MNFRALTGNKVVRLLKMTFDAWMEDNALRLSAALAYYSIFSIAPLLVIAISIAGLVFGDEAARGQVGEYLKGYVGPKAAEGVQAMVQSASKPSQGWLGAVVGFATLMLGASGVFGQLKDALNTIWEVKVEKTGGVLGFVRARLLNFGMVLIIGFLLLTSLLLSTALAGFTGYIEHLIGLPAAVGVIFGFLVSLAGVTLLFGFIFKVLPDVEIEWRNVWIGAAVTALLFEIGKFGLSFYLGRESTESSYGAAASIVLLLLWAYYASCILLFGAEFTQVYAKETGHAIKPAEGAVPVTAEARAQQGLAAGVSSSKDRGSGSRVGATEQPRQVPQFRVVPIAASPPGPNPLGRLLATIGATFLLGLLARRNREQMKSPAMRLREDLGDLGEDAAAQLGGFLKRAGREVKRRKERWS